MQHTAANQISKYLARLRRLPTDFKGLAHTPTFHKSYSLPSEAQGPDVKLPKTTSQTRSFGQQIT